MKYIKNYENDEKFKKGDLAVMISNDYKKYKVLNVTNNTIWIDYNTHPMEFLTKDFLTEVEYDTLKYNL